MNPTVSNFGANTFYSIIYIMIIITTWGGYMTKEEILKVGLALERIQRKSNSDYKEILRKIEELKKE